MLYATTVFVYDQRNERERERGKKRRKTKSENTILISFSKPMIAPKCESARVHITRINSFWLRNIGAFVSLFGKIIMK